MPKGGLAPGLALVHLCVAAADEGYRSSLSCHPCSRREPMRVAANLTPRPGVLVDGLRKIIDRAWTAVLPSVVEDISPPVDHDRARENAARFRRHSAEVMVQRSGGSLAR